MSKALVVVESPAKAKTIKKYLGDNFVVKASMGHLRDLPKSQFGVDLERDFTPKYINIRGKGDLIKSLKDDAKKAGKVYLATDPDREGEAIAWHLAHILNISPDKTCRIEFNEITKPAIQRAVKNPRRINQARVDAQQARRILDRIVGYKLSPLLWRKVRKGLSAGRVQSVALRLICDREKEIQAFTPEEYWSITVKLKEKAKAPVFDAELISVNKEKISILNQAEAERIQAELEQADFIVGEIKMRERRRNPAPPYITSSLQQDASRRLGFTSRKTMLIAQQLYEGLDIENMGPVGLISYIRTDSTRVSELAQQEARKYISVKYGDAYLPEKTPVYTNKKSQDAHEAIRPTSLELPPERVQASLSRDQFRLYSLIWERFLASQMAAAVYDTLSIDINAGIYTLRSTGSQIKFSGFLAVYSGSGNSEEIDKDVTLPDLTIGQSLKLHKVNPKQHFTEPPPRFTEASLVKTLEENGIGRPSTYAPIIETLIERGYVIRTEKKFEPTDLGFVVVDLLKEYFPNIVDIDFTANLENRLDDIAEGEAQYTAVLKEFYDPFSKTLKYAEEQIGHIELPEKVSDIKCENCGRFMVVKTGRFGDFLACPGFPECRNTKPILKDTGVKCPLCQSAIVERKTKRGRKFYGCEKYPECGFTTWDTPLKETCQICGAFMSRHNFKKGSAVICSNKDCLTHQKVSRVEDKKNKSVKTNRRKQSG